MTNTENTTPELLDFAAMGINPMRLIGFMEGRLKRGKTIDADYWNQAITAMATRDAERTDAK